MYIKLKSSKKLYEYLSDEYQVSDFERPPILK